MLSIFIISTLGMDRETSFTEMCLVNLLFKQAYIFFSPQIIYMKFSSTSSNIMLFYVGKAETIY